ncbi:MAG: iron-sulfur cluster assembly scaffold protein [Bryobacteraceae bacterium]|jgi:nitrogen fixation NifU-like protein
MYSARLLDHFNNPRNIGELPVPAVTVRVTNPACGDILQLSVEFRGGRVGQVRYKVRGCTASIAAGSVLTEWLAGKTPGEMAALRQSDIEDALDGLNPESKHAAALCVDAVRALTERIT